MIFKDFLIKYTNINTKFIKDCYYKLNQINNMINKKNKKLKDKKIPYITNKDKLYLLIPKFNFQLNNDYIFYNLFYNSNIYLSLSSNSLSFSSNYCYKLFII
jgi:hypothetical protein